MQHVSPVELQRPLHPLLPEYLSEAWGGAAVAAAAARGEKGSEICVFVRASDCVIWMCQKVDDVLFLRQQFVALKKKQSAFHMRACKTARDALTRDQCRQQCNKKKKKKRNINRPKGTRIPVDCSGCIIKRTFLRRPVIWHQPPREQ